MTEDEWLLARIDARWEYREEQAEYDGKWPCACYEEWLNEPDADEPTEDDYNDAADREAHMDWRD